jgi:hypothetical protein
MSQVKQVGNSATGFSNNFMNMLGGLLGGPGSGGAQTSLSNPVGQTQGNAQNILQGILSPGGGSLGGSLGTMISQQQNRDVAGLNERFSSAGGTSLGSPAAGATAQYKAQAAPAAATAIGNLQLGAISPLLQAGGYLAGRGVTTPMMQTNPIIQGLQALPGLSQGTGSILSALGMMGGGGGNSNAMGTNGQSPTGLDSALGGSLQSLLPFLLAMG